MRTVAILLAFTSAVAAQPSPELTAEFQKGIDEYRLGHFAEAKAHLEKAKALDPKLPGPNRYLAAVAQAQQRWDDCIEAARKAIELNPRSGEIADTKKLHDECRVSAGRTPYREDLGDSGAIAVRSNAIGATVKVGGLNYGATPLEPRPITAGPLEIDIEKQGWLPKHVTANALPGIVTDVIIDLEPDPKAQSNTDLNQKGAEFTTGKLLVPADVVAITVDDKSMQPKGGELELPPGNHVLVVERPDHDPWRRRVRIMAGQKTRVIPTFVETAPRETKEHIGEALLGVGGAISVFGFYAMMKSEDGSKDAREINRLETAHPPKGEFTRKDFDDAVDRSKKWSLISTVSFGAALVSFGVGGIYMYLGAKERSDVPPPFAVTPVNGGAVVSRGVSW